MQRWRIVQARIRLWTQSVRDLVMGLSCALPHIRVRLTHGSQQLKQETRTWEAPRGRRSPQPIQAGITP